MKQGSDSPPPIAMKWNEVTKRTLVKLRNEVKQGSDSPPPTPCEGTINNVNYAGLSKEVPLQAVCA